MRSVSYIHMYSIIYRIYLCVPFYIVQCETLAKHLCVWEAEDVTNAGTQSSFNAFVTLRPKLNEIGLVTFHVKKKTVNKSNKARQKSFL